MKIKRIRYKGIPFNFFWAYNLDGDTIGGPNEEISRKEIDSFGVTACPHCIEKYNLYGIAIAFRKPEEIEKDGGEETICCVEGCRNGISYDIFFHWMDVDIEEI